ncbi:MAG: ferrous iron transport protein A [Clostridia bacterium]|nr:ferrous iron transport protein A [Clostridia bacterium]
MSKKRKKNVKRKQKTVTLDTLPAGSEATVDRLTSKCNMKDRLTSLGFCRGEKIVCVMESPLGDPTAYLIRGTLVALRRSDARGVAVLL